MSDNEMIEMKPLTTDRPSHEWIVFLEQIILRHMMDQPRPPGMSMELCRDIAALKDEKNL